MKTIVWDVDDVLNDLMREWFERAWLPSHPECMVRYETLLENPPHKILGIDHKGYLASLDKFRRSEDVSRMPPNPEVSSWFRQYGQRFCHLALTAVPMAFAPESAAWVTRHFGAWIRSFHFVPSPRDGMPAIAYDRDKEDFLRWWGRADILVDDNPAHVEGAKRLGIKAMLVPRPWNRAKGTLGDVLESIARISDIPL